MDNRGEMPNQDFQKNTLADMVVSEVPSYEVFLNAPTLEKADRKFTQALISVLRNKRVGGKLGDGGQVLVYELIGSEDVVIKRLRAGGNMKLQGERSIDEYWADLQKEHALAEKYFGRRFVPYTEFVEVDGTNFGDPNPDMLSDKEYVMVQERIFGQKLHMQKPSIHQEAVSPGLKQEIIEFIKRYELMMRSEGLILEDQLMINYDTEEVKISDTNHFRSFRNLISSGKDFLDEFNIDSQSIRTTQDVIDAFVTHLPAYASLREASPTEITRACYATSLPWSETYQDLKSRYSISGQKKVVDGFRALATAIFYFPPEGAHNFSIRMLMKGFGISNSELDLLTPSLSS